MDEFIRALVLNNGFVVISIVEELFADPGEPDCKLINPYLYENGNLKKWIDFSDQNEIVISSKNILTIVDPNEEIIKQYLKLISE